MPHQCTTCRRVFPDGSKEMLSGCPDCGGNKFQFQPAGSAEPGDGDAATDAAAAADAAATGDAGDAPAEPPEPPEPETPGGSVAETVAGATERVRNLVGGDDRDWPAVGREDADGTGSATADATTPEEDTAQASARTSVVERDELPDPPDRGEPELEPSAGESDASAGQSPTSPAAGQSQTSPDAGAASERPDAAAREPSDGDEPGSAPLTGSGDREAETPDLAELREELNDQFESIRIVERGQYELNLMELYDREEYIISLLEDGRYAIEVPETWRDD